MKKITTLFLSVISTALLAQIPNPSFESWTSGTPTGWRNVTSSIAGTITQVTTAHAGTYAVQINSVLNGPYYFGGELISSPKGAGYFANSGNPVALNGWYIANLNGGDELELGGGTKCPNDSIDGSAVVFITANTSVYKQFSACFYYAKSCTSDSAFVSLYLYNSSGFAHAGSYVTVDDLSYGPCVTGIPEIDNTVTVEAAYPNPASTTCNIIYSIPSYSQVSIALYDINGRKVKDLLDNLNQTSGRYKIPVDVSDLSNGIYIYKVVVNGQSFAQKLSVVK